VQAQGPLGFGLHRLRAFSLGQRQYFPTKSFEKTLKNYLFIHIFTAGLAEIISRNEKTNYRAAIFKQKIGIQGSIH